MKLLKGKQQVKKYCAKKYDKSEVLQCYALIGLQIIGFLLITLYPMVWAVRLSCFYYDGVASKTRFLGFENFLTLFTKDKVYWQAWLTTLKYAAMKIPIELPLAMFIAILLKRNLRFKGFFRAMFYMPSIVGIAIVGVIFFNMFDFFGIINSWITRIIPGKEPIEWFSNTSTAMLVLVIGDVWRTFGVNALYFTAALCNVPENLYEAAEIEGASRWTMFRKITLPIIAPVVQIVLLLSINGTLHVNEYILTMTGGAPYGTTHTVMSYIVKMYVPGFAGNSVNIGYGCAVSVVTSVIMAAIAIIYMKSTKKISDNT